MPLRSHPGSPTPTGCHPSRPARQALTLLEVLVSLAIFLLALVGIGQLISLGNERARDVQDQAEGLQRCQSKLNELVSGAAPLQTQNDVPYEDQTNWRWTVECTQTDIPNLWTVRATVTRDRYDGATPQVTLTQLVFDPTVRGGTSQASEDTSSSSSSSSSTTPSP
ncbi:MAG: prepilin-type N-terminal cleavage/methylation domain-containing protein [Gemmataceae bacterium]|nr:prepilin-type N-terminal cleavage/methylation domain-containing protein [Gemmataceae bacterium]